MARAMECTDLLILIWCHGTAAGLPGESGRKPAAIQGAALEALHALNTEHCSLNTFSLLHIAPKKQKRRRPPEPAPLVISPVVFAAYLKFAVSDKFEFTVTVIVRDLLTTAPVQPTHGDPAAGVAVSVTTVPGAYDVALGVMVTVPLPAVATLIL